MDNLSLNEELSDRFRRFTPMRILKIAFLAASIGFVLWFIPWAPLLYREKISVKRLDAKGKPFFEDVGPSTKNWVTIGKTSRHFVHAVVVGEDGRFYDHWGIDPREIAHSWQLNRRRGKYVRGGSTITQQVVKMAFLSREKTIIRKLREISGALFLEMTMSKDKILEWYINLAEFGGGIYGVKAAGNYYFKTRPELLSVEQSIQLAIVIPNPNKWSISLRQKKLTPFADRRFKHFAKLMRRRGWLTDDQYAHAMTTGNFGSVLSGEYVEKSRPVIDNLNNSRPPQLAPIEREDEDEDLEISMPGDDEL